MDTEHRERKQIDHLIKKVRIGLQLTEEESETLRNYAVGAGIRITTHERLKWFMDAKLQAAHRGRNIYRHLKHEGLLDEGASETDFVTTYVMGVLSGAYQAFYGMFDSIAMTELQALSSVTEGRRHGSN